MEKRIDDKIIEIKEYLEQLSEIMPSNLEEYKSNFEKKAACERYFEVIIESVVDLAFLIIKNKSLKIPENDKQAFDILESSNIINNNLNQKLKNAKGMRNIIAHEYGKVDDEIVFHAITEELINDVEQFINNIKEV